ncbi:MAG TPA: hypothetical protein VLG50_06140 [Candidatus Saccharimonadales bacterium]|nr:hypothetical protein [Candidatus Saccharimonadales bacterium]
MGKTSFYSDNAESFLFKYAIYRLGCLFLLLTVSMPTQTFIDEIVPTCFYGNAIVKDPVIELNNNFPPPQNSQTRANKESSRAHQCLFNEIVTVLEQRDDCVKVMCKNAIYGFHNTTKDYLNSFWIYKKDIIALQDLDKQVLDAIPNPAYGHDPTIVLVYPWKLYSIGTRFKRAPKHDTAQYYAIQLPNFNENAVLIDFVPRIDALVEIKKNQRLARRLFVKIINELVDRVFQNSQDPACIKIPYVLGGSSFVMPYNDETEKNDISYGYDCSEFILRMAQIAGIDFPWKTSSAMERFTKELTPQDTLQDGDIIWVPGHVIIVSNIKNNEIIESRKSVYACVCKSTLDKRFEGISTYDDLMTHYHSHKTIKFKDVPADQGAEKIYSFKLLKLID